MDSTGDVSHPSILPSIHPFIHPSIHPSIHVTMGSESNVSSLLVEFPSYWDWLWCPGPCWCPSPIPSPSRLSISIHSSSSVIEFHSCFFFTADVGPIATNSVDPSLTHLLGEFPGLELALVPADVFPEAELDFLSGFPPIARIFSRGNPLGVGG